MRQAWKKGVAVLAFGLLAAQAGSAPASEAAGTTAIPMTPKGRASYSIGVDTGKYLLQQGIEVDQEFLVKGIQDALSGNKPLLSDEELQETLMLVVTEAKQRKAQARKHAAEEKKKETDQFFAANKASDGVVAMPSGLQYKIIKAGDGAKPGDADTVECLYRGILLDGTVFGGTDGTGRAAAFTLSDTKAVIPGLREALKLMPVGSKWRIFIPPELAYGAQGSGSIIGPNAALIFDLELVAIKG